MQSRPRPPENSGSHTDAWGHRDMQSSACLPASPMPEPAGSACPLCGVSVRHTDLQAHVAADLDKLDRAASDAQPLAENVALVAGAARKRIEPSALQLDSVRMEQQQQQQPFHHTRSVPHAETSCNGAVYTHHRNALGESSSLAGNCASNAQHCCRKWAHAASQGLQHSNNARASSQAARAKQTDENARDFSSSGAALGHGPAQKCPQQRRRQAAGMRSAAQHQAGRCQLSQEQAHTLGTCGRGPLQQQERRWKPCRNAGVKRNTQVTRSIWALMQGRQY